jgi:hypothetical protein
MRTPRSRTFPVTVTRMLRVRCAVCGRLLAHRAGEANKVLTAHYAKEHAAVLGTDADSDAEE